MSKAFTTYWKPEGWEGLPIGKPIEYAGGSGFKGKVAIGDRIYVTNVFNGELRLLGAFNVESVKAAAIEGKPVGATWISKEYLLALEETATPLLLRTVPMDIVKSLRFFSGKEEVGVKLSSNGKVDRQTMRRIRELTPESVAKLEELLGGETSSDWTVDELEKSVEAYLGMAHRLKEGVHVVKSEIYKNLAAKIGRSAKSCEYRMQNISFILHMMGRDWIKGLPPAKNVGARVAIEIERLIGEVENQYPLQKVGEALAVKKIRNSSVKSRPKGQKTPKTVSSNSTSFVRDPAVKAWVLDRAHGVCEACDSSAPFVGADGFPFLEVHHVRTLADGGSDTVTNAVAVCPNCHRRLHYSEDSKAYRQSLYEKVTELDLE